MTSTLLRTEWLKIKKYKAFWWMTGIVALSYPGINYLFHHIYQEQLNGDMKGILTMLSNPFTFPEVWHTVAYLSSWFVIIPALVVIMFITNEYTYKTHRQNVIDGWSRSQFMLAKMMDVLIISLMVLVLYILISLIIGYLNSNHSMSDIAGETKYIPLFFLQTFSQLSIAFLVALLARKAFIALGIFIFYYFIFENAVVGLARHYLNDEGRFMPLEISDRLIPLPRFLIRHSEEWQKMMDAQNVHIIYTILLTTLVWAICFRINNRRDL